MPLNRAYFLFFRDRDPPRKLLIQLLLGREKCSGDKGIYEGVGKAERPPHEINAEGGACFFNSIWIPDQRDKLHSIEIDRQATYP